MDGITKMESYISSAAAFVEGGIQDACEDACCICLEAFCDSEPSTVTCCKHEFHLQCILEWCQRSSQCPMCWQTISLKDPTSQELLEAVDKERKIRLSDTRSTNFFHHPELGDFELQHLPVGTTDCELEERIIQHLAAAAAMGRAHRIARRGDGQRARSTMHEHPQLLVFSENPNVPAAGSVSDSSPQRRENESPAGMVATNSSTLITPEEMPHVTSAHAEPNISSGATNGNANGFGLLNNRVSAGQPSTVGQDRAGPSDSQSFSESLKSRLHAVSLRYRESITKSTRGWKERWFSRNTSVTEIGSEVRREVSAGIATVSRMMERLDTRESKRNVGASTAQSTGAHSVSEQINEKDIENHSNALPSNNTPSIFCATTSSSN